MWRIVVFVSLVTGHSSARAKDSRGSTSLLATVGCDGRSSKKELLDMSVALLHAHRCVVKDVAVEVPIPENTIPDLIIPSHIVVPRCTGLCLNSIGSSCFPKKTRLENHNIVVYVNSTPYCTTIQLEHHRGPCRCDCEKTDRTCAQLSTRHIFSPETCNCVCDPSLTSEKIACENKTNQSNLGYQPSLHYWNQDTCSCSCINQVACHEGMKWDDETCGCIQLESACLVNQAAASYDNEGRYNLYPIYLTSIILVLIILIITSLCFTISHRMRTRQSYTQHTLTPNRCGQPTAYTITLCSSQNLDKTT